MQIDKSTLTTDYVTIIFADSEKVHGARYYRNSACQLGQGGRADLEAECTADIVKIVEEKWGSTPTMTEPTYPTPPTPQPTAEQKQLAAMTLQQAQMTTTITALQQANAALMLKIAGGN